MSDNSIAQLAETINTRLTGAGPFLTPRGAWNGSETVARLDGDITIYVTIVGKTVFLRATNRTQFLGEQLPVARRVGRGEYEILLYQEDIEQWLQSVLPQPEAPVSLLDLALVELSQKGQWPTGESITIWQNNGHQAWLRNESGFITLTLFKDAAKLKNRKYSKRLTIGYYHPGDCAWLESEHLREDYPRWAEQARREVGA